MVLISLVPALTTLYLYVSTFRSMCVVPNMAVLCSSLTSWFPGMLFTHFLNDVDIIIIIIIIIIIKIYSRVLDIKWQFSDKFRSQREIKVICSSTLTLKTLN